MAKVVPNPSDTFHKRKNMNMQTEKDVDVIDANPKNRALESFTGGFICVAVIAICLIGFVDAASAAGKWYVRASAGAVWGEDADFTDRDCASSTPPALFGCGEGSDGRALGAYGDFGEYLVTELAAGAHVTPWLRIEVAAHYRPNMVYSGTANFLNVAGPQPVSTKARSIGLMVCGFLEIERFLKLSGTRWHPYIGGGLGFSKNRLERVNYRFPEASVHTHSITPSGRRLDKALMASCGLGVDLTEQWGLDFSLRYEDLGAVETEQGPMYMDHISQDIEIAETTADIRGWGLVMGVRYYF
jgi:opacity protein-like surface antigen